MFGAEERVSWVWWAGRRVGGSLPFADRSAQSFVFSLDTSDFAQMGGRGGAGGGGGEEGRTPERTCLSSSRPLQV